MKYNPNFDPELMRRANHCGAKRPYDSKGAAKQAARHLAKRFPGSPKEAYLCQLCSHWHIGRSIRKEMSEISLQMDVSNLQEPLVD